MADPLDQAEFNQAIREEPEGPALPTFRRRATGQGNQVGFHLARDLLGHTRWEGLIIKRRRQASSEKAAADISDSVAMTPQGLRHGLIGKGVCLGMIQEQQDTGAGVRPGWRPTSPAQGIECRPVVIS